MLRQQRFNFLKVAGQFFPKISVSGPYLVSVSGLYLVSVSGPYLVSYMTSVIHSYTKKDICETKNVIFNKMRGQECMTNLNMIGGEGGERVKHQLKGEKNE